MKAKIKLMLFNTLIRPFGLAGTVVGYVSGYWLALTGRATKRKPVANAVKSDLVREYHVLVTLATIMQLFGRVGTASNVYTLLKHRGSGYLTPADGSKYTDMHRLMSDGNVRQVTLELIIKYDGLTYEAIDNKMLSTCEYNLSAWVARSPLK